MTGTPRTAQLPNLDSRDEEETTEYTVEEDETDELMPIELNPPVEGEDQRLLEDSVTTPLAKSIIQKTMASINPGPHKCLHTEPSLI